MAVSEIDDTYPARMTEGPVAEGANARKSL